MNDLLFMSGEADGLCDGWVSWATVWLLGLLLLHASFWLGFLNKLHNRVSVEGRCRALWWLCSKKSKHSPFVRQFEQSFWLDLNTLDGKVDDRSERAFWMRILGN